MSPIGKLKYHLLITGEIGKCALEKSKIMKKPKIDSNINLEGNVIIVTGGNRGIGRGAVELLTEQGARVIIATCELEEAKQVVEENPQAKIDVHFLDLSSYKSVKSFAEKILKTEERIDCLLNNAGVIVPSYKETEDGIELAKQVNFLAPLLLSSLLLPLLEKSKGRIVNVASFGHVQIESMQLDETNWWCDANNYDPIRTYVTTKLAVLLVTRYMSEKLSSRGIRVYAVDPGIANSKIISTLASTRMEVIINKCIGGLVRSTKDAGVSLVLTVVHNSDEYIPGRKYHMYYGKFTKTSILSMNDQCAQQMWSYANKLINGLADI